jgi:hypothetical protein
MMKYFILSPFILSTVIALLTACGGTGQDKPSKTTASQQFISGVAIDGHLARATVFLDTNDNSTRDPWEAFAFTDNEGYFSTNPTTNANYCATTATKEQSQYCLSAPADLVSVVLRIEGGYDIITGEPFFGQMSRRIKPNGKNVMFSTITPLTTLLSSAETTAEINKILTSLNISESDLDIDYFKSDSAVNIKLLTLALKLHKVTTLLSDRLVDTYLEIGEEMGTPNDATSVVYEKMADEMINTSASVSDIISDEKTLIRILDSSEKILQTIYTSNELALPTDLGDSGNPNKLVRVAEISSHINDIIDGLIPSDASADNKRTLGAIRALETIIIKSTSEGETKDKSIDNAITFFTDDTKPELVQAFSSGLNGDNFDLSSLSSNSFDATELSTPEKIASITQIPDTIVPFSQLGGYRIKVSDPDLGQAPNNLKDEEIEFYFKGNATSFSGEFGACAKHIKGAKSDGTLGEGNTRGEVITGFWSLLGATTQHPKSYSLLITLKFLGANYQAIMKPAAANKPNNQETQFFRFDNNGEFVVWDSADGFISNVSIPSSNKECELRLPSRVGL